LKHGDYARVRVLPLAKLTRLEEIRLVAVAEVAEQVDGLEQAAGEGRPAPA